MCVCVLHFEWSFIHTDIQCVFKFCPFGGVNDNYYKRAAHAKLIGRRANAEKEKKKKKEMIDAIQFETMRSIGTFAVIAVAAVAVAAVAAAAAAKSCKCNNIRAAIVTRLC